MAWCVECWSQDRRTEPGTKVLDAEDLCDLHYRKALGEGLPAVPKNVPPMPAAHSVTLPAVQLAAGFETKNQEPKSQAAAEPRLKEKERANMSKRLCACGCGEELSPEDKRSFLNGHKPSEKAKRLCGCGCGTALVNRHPYIKGHNPDAKKKATPAPHNGKDKRPVTIRGGQQSNGGGAAVHIPLTVTVPLRGEHLDAMWGRLSLQEKADKLFPAE
jgi:hypothetical protein